MKSLLSEKILRQLRRKPIHEKDAAESSSSHRKSSMLLSHLSHEAATVHPEHDELEPRKISDIEAGDESQKFRSSESEVTQVRV